MDSHTLIQFSNKLLASQTKIHQHWGEAIVDIRNLIESCASEDSWLQKMQRVVAQFIEEESLLYKQTGNDVHKHRIDGARKILGAV